MEKLETRTVDDLGRIVLPWKFREVHGLEEGAKVDFYQENDTIVIKPSKAAVERTEPLIMARYFI